MPHTEFSAVSFPWRLYSGQDALDNLIRVVERRGVERAFVICGRSVAHKTDLITRIKSIVGDKFAGVYDGMTQEAPLGCVQAAANAAKAAGADMLIAVGAGTVIKATRVVAILMAEDKPAEELMTRYPPSGPAISPKLMAPKLPIVNVLTAATSAQNRAGAAVKQVEVGHRMEFFDPKTRPCAIFWDADALLTAPANLALNTGVAVYWRALMNMGAIAIANPLIEGDRYHCFRLADRSIRRITEADPEPRIEMCAAAFIQNREEDEGRVFSDTHWVARVVYALGASTFSLCDTIGQGQSYAALTAPAIRVFGERNPNEMAGIGRALGLEDLQPGVEAIPRIADTMEAFFSQLGLKTRLRDYGVQREQLPRILEFSMKNYNADRNRHFLNETQTLTRALEQAW
ncbi:MAG TPA: iron-containing alcohol dehydrogenase family protein [Burkholderiales bacterium]|nr:iron-containing alcohol dehydrogenase family protein [Burkholderiales bacterium]